MAVVAQAESTKSDVAQRPKSDQLRASPGVDGAALYSQVAELSRSREMRPLGICICATDNARIAAPVAPVAQKSGSDGTSRTPRGDRWGVKA